MLIVRADMYSEKDVETLLTSYQKLVQAFASTPDISFAQPEIFDPREIERALEFGRGTHCTFLSFFLFPSNLVRRATNSDQL